MSNGSSLASKPQPSNSLKRGNTVKALSVPYLQSTERATLQYSDCRQCTDVSKRACFHLDVKEQLIQRLPTQCCIDRTVAVVNSLVPTYKTDREFFKHKKIKCLHSSARLHPSTHERRHEIMACFYILLATTCNHCTEACNHIWSDPITSTQIEGKVKTPKMHWGKLRSDQRKTLASIFWQWEHKHLYRYIIFHNSIK